MPIETLEQAILEKVKPEELLLVDDDAYIRDIFKQYSTGYNCAWTMVGTATEAVALVKERKFRLVLLDLRLPCMLGKQAFEKITEARPDQPIVILSGYLDPMVMADIERAGFAMFLCKPVSMHDKQFIEKMFAVLQIKKLPEPPLTDSPSI